MQGHGPIVERPASAFAAGAGLLRAEHFQMAWATNDLARAKAEFSERLGINQWTPLGGPMASGGEIAVELAWVGSTMYELLTASGPGSEIYMSRLTGTGYQVRHHHLGFFVGDSAEWDALEAEAARAGWSIPHKSVNPGFMTSCFVDVPLLGHYLEYIMPEPAGVAFFQGVARN